VGASRVTLGWVLDLDYIGTEVAQDRACERAGEQGGGVNDFEALKGLVSGI
jgi:hypothetical protein